MFEKKRTPSNARSMEVENNGKPPVWSSKKGLSASMLVNQALVLFDGFTSPLGSSWVGAQIDLGHAY